MIVHRDYGLPAFAQGPQTLVVCSSHSGNTEETLELIRDRAEERMQRGRHLHGRRTGETRRGEKDSRLALRAQRTTPRRGWIFLRLAACPCSPA